MLTLNKSFWSGASGGAASTATLEAQLTMTTDNYASWDQNFTTGALWHQTYQPLATWGGQVDCCRISDVNRYPSATSVSDTIDQPTSEFSTDSDTLYLMNFNNSSLAVPDYPTTITATGSTSSRNTSNTMFSSAGSWEGDGSYTGGSTYLYYAAQPSAIFNLRYNSAFTFEAFFYTDTDNGDQQGIMSNYYTNPQFWFSITSWLESPQKTTFTWWTSGGAFYELKSTSTLSLNTWYYYAVTNTTGGLLSTFLGEV